MRSDGTVTFTESKSSKLDDFLRKSVTEDIALIVLSIKEGLPNS